jgi:hypothetical protein
MLFRRSAVHALCSCLLVSLIFLAVAERRVWESGFNDQTESQFRNEDSGKVVNLLVGLDRVDVPWIPGIEPALEWGPAPLETGSLSLLAVPRPAPRAPPIH